MPWLLKTDRRGGRSAVEVTRQKADRAAVKALTQGQDLPVRETLAEATDWIFADAERAESWEDSVGGWEDSTD